MEIMEYPKRVKYLALTGPLEVIQTRARPPDASKPPKQSLISGDASRMGRSTDEPEKILCVLTSNSCF
jgi:hypothetical protein